MNWWCSNGMNGRKMKRYMQQPRGKLIKNEINFSWQIGLTLDWNSFHCDFIFNRNISSIWNIPLTKLLVKIIVPYSYDKYFWRACFCRKWYVWKWPLKVQMGRYHVDSRSKCTALWDTMHSLNKEMFNINYHWYFVGWGSAT